jgi:nucleotide-binding universal stress UspA family protein
MAEVQLCDIRAPHWFAPRLFPHASAENYAPMPARCDHAAGRARPGRPHEHRPGGQQMYDKIIVGYDGSEQAQDALALGGLIAAAGGELVVAGVFQWDPVWGGPDSAFRKAEAEYARQVEEAAARVGGEAEAIPSSSAPRGLHDLAQELHADLVVVGSARHSRVGEVFAGSVASSLLHGSPCSVAVAPRGYANEAPESLTEIVLGFDGSEEAKTALADAIDLTRASGALLKVVSVAEPPPVVAGKAGAREALARGIEEMTRDLLDSAVRSLPEDIRAESRLISGEPASALVELATADGALLMLGSRGYGPVRRVLLGTVASALVRGAPCPVVVHPRPAEGASHQD